MTSEDGGSGLRGLNGQGIITTSSALQDSLIWDDVVYLSQSGFSPLLVNEIESKFAKCWMKSLHVDFFNRD